MTVGRPSNYDPAICDIICNELSGGVSLRKICERDEMPGQSTVFQWLAKHKEFSEQYARAREAWADAEIENILDIADDKSEDTIVDDEGNERVNSEFIARSRLRVDTRKWALGKLHPKKYGDKTAIEHSGSVGIQQILAEQDGRSAGLPDVKE